MNMTKRRWPDFEHTGPGTLAGKYMRNFWQPVYISADLKPSTARPLKIMGQVYTIYRGASGAAHVIADKCLHRGTLLSTGVVDGERIQCFYHGWKYDTTGTCIERPAEKTCPESLKIRTYPTVEWADMVFAYLGEGEPPEFPKLKCVEGDGFLIARPYFRGFNYFKQMENALDETHIPFVHRISRFAAQGLTTDVPTLTCEETDYGLKRSSIRAGVERKTHFMMPNANASILFDAVHIVWRVPIDDFSHISFTLDYFDGSTEDVAIFREEREREVATTAAARPANEIVDEILAGQSHVNDHVDHPDLLSIQDGVALKGQGIIADRESELLGLSDMHIVRMRRLWVADLDAVANGQPPRKWQWPADLEITSGLPGEAEA